mgnify:CR=1 FL=1
MRVRVLKPYLTWHVGDAVELDDALVDHLVATGVVERLAEETEHVRPGGRSTRPVRPLEEPGA